MSRRSSKNRKRKHSDLSTETVVPSKDLDDSNPKYWSKEKYVRTETFWH